MFVRNWSGRRWVCSRNQRGGDEILRGDVRENGETVIGESFRGVREEDERERALRKVRVGEENLSERGESFRVTDNDGWKRRFREINAPRRVDEGRVG